MKMKNLGLLAASLAMIIFAQISTAAAATSTLTIPIAAQMASGETGTATLTQAGPNVTVVLAIKGAPATTPQPAHIHTGTCTNLGGIAYPLTNVVAGTSTTTVKGVTIDKLLGASYAINVHASADNLGKYVACGQITKPSTGM
jgi:Cu/Zn superoxide dismutase